MRRLVTVVLCAATVGLGACGNPFSQSYTHAADTSVGAGAEILANYPGARDVVVEEANNNPNILRWVTADGQFCTAQATAVNRRPNTPAHLITIPYCRKPALP